MIGVRWWVMYARSSTKNDIYEMIHGNWLYSGLTSADLKHGYSQYIRIGWTVVTNRWHEFRRMLSEMRFVRMFYKSWTQVLQSLGFEWVQISFCWQGQGKMISQLVRSVGMSLHVDPRIARIPQTVSAKGHLASKADKVLVPRHSDLWKCLRKVDTYPSRSWILENRY